MLRILVALLLLPFTQARAQTPGPSDIQEGKRIWQGYFGLENDCKLCHGEHGEGGFAKALAGHQLSTAQFLRTVRQGAGKTMPAFVADKNLSDQQLSQVAAYLASLPKPAESASHVRAADRQQQHPGGATQYRIDPHWQGDSGRSEWRAQLRRAGPGRSVDQRHRRHADAGAGGCWLIG